MIADIVIQRLLDATDRLSDFPASGGVVPYGVIYQVLEDRVRIVAVIHGARMVSGEAQE